MRSRILKIPIMLKLITLFLGLLIASTSLFVLQTSQSLEKELLRREEYSNMTEASAKAIEVEQQLVSLIERSQKLGALFFDSLSQTTSVAQPLTPDSVNLQDPTQGISQISAFSAAFEKEAAFVNIEIWQQKGSQLRLHTRKTKESFLLENKLTADLFENLRGQQAFPLTSIMAKNFEFRNASRPDGPAIATLGLPLVKDSQDQVTHILLIDFRLAVIQKSFANESERVLFLVDRAGNLMAHPDEKQVFAQKDFSKNELKDELVVRALPDTQPRRQVMYFDALSHEEVVGAYVKLEKLGVIVFSKILKSTIVAPAYEMKRSAFKTAGIILSVAIVLIFLFSMTLTGPIEILATLVRHVSTGNFDIKASDRVKAWVEDEVHDLAHAFDNMTEGLKERDKVKSLFSKFHGSSVAEDLIKNDIGVGGQNKEVTVFFSDIRGFTAFSENRSPEEVVEMLNEYFEVMVGIINRNHGVVDKFIGDAIMAVWGAPHTSETDTQNALKACLEMRVALVELNTRRASRDQGPIRIGMGLHTGRAISGTIGSNERMEYTVIGDTVNMSSRIEASTKAFGSDLLVSQSVVDKIGPSYLVEVAGEASVKGKTEPLKLYKVRGYLNEETGEETIIETEFSQAPPEYDEKVKKTG